jgi:predicted SAM-dependent methyltransferase
MPDEPGRKLLADAAAAMRLSARGFHRVLRVSRTIADLAGVDRVGARIKLNDERRVLNLGCGNQTYGTHRVDIYSTNTTTHVFDIEKGLLFSDSFFDEVYERNVFEHLKNPNFHLSEVHRVLKPNGLLTLITDNAACVRYYLLGTHTGGYMGHRRYLKPSEDKHYGVFTTEHIKNHALSAGFKIISMKYVETDFSTKFVDRLARKIMPKPLKSLTYPRIYLVAKK